MLLYWASRVTPEFGRLLVVVCHRRTSGLGWADEPGTAAVGLSGLGRSTAADSFGSGVAVAFLACGRRAGYLHYRNIEIATHRHCPPSD